MKRFLLLFPAFAAMVTTALLVAAGEAKPAADADAAKAKPLKVLMVCGGCCHDYENQKRILAEGLSARANVEFTIVHEEGPEGKKDKTHRISIYEKEDWAKGYDLVLHNECFGAIEDVAFVERIAKPHKDGVPAVVLHCSAHSYRAAKTDEWRKVVGQKSMSHEKNRDLLVKNTAPEHPVMKGFPMEWLNPKDELYKNEELYPGFVPLAKAYGEDTKKEHHVIWVNTYGKGKVFGTTLGHNNSTMESPEYLDLVARGLLWACDKLDDSGKPVAGYGPAQK
jgi:type 1 glutamine amidotransferase